MKKKASLVGIIILLVLSGSIIFVVNIIKFSNDMNGNSDEVWPYNSINYTTSITIPENSKVKIAIIDTGVSAESPCLKMWNIKKFKIADVTDNDNKHGTLVSSSLCSNKMMHQKTEKGGILLNNTILYSIDIGTDKNITVDSLIKGVNLAIEEKVNIINLSIGTYKNDPRLEESIKKAIEQNIIVVAAAGNDMTRQDLYPAAYPNVISVSAYDEEENYVYANNINKSIKISAPGMNISTGFENVTGKPSKMGGTSISCTMVTALATVLKNLDNGLNSQEFIKVLEHTSRDLGKNGRDEYFGFGVINFRKAIAYTSNKFFYNIIDVFY